MDPTGPYRSRPPPERAPGAGSYECPACTISVRDEVRNCPRCGTPIATVRCARCFHMNVQEAPLCVGCGHELGLEPVGGPGTLACPDCNRQLLAFKGEGGVLHDCGRCGGQFVDHALLEALLAGRERYGQAAPHKPPRHNPLDSPVRYVRCPACLEIMTRKNFGRVSGIIVDVCRQHGMWFDVGELPRVLAFAEAGGLALAREKEIEARAELMARRKLEAENAFAGLSGPVHPFDRTIASTRMAEAGAALLAFVRQTLRGG